jgi:hypothetical protein
LRALSKRFAVNGLAIFSSTLRPRPLSTPLPTVQPPVLSGYYRRWPDGLQGEKYEVAGFFRGLVERCRR